MLRQAQWQLTTQSLRPGGHPPFVIRPQVDDLASSGGPENADGVDGGPRVTRQASESGRVRSWLVSEAEGMRVYASPDATGHKPWTRVFTGSDGSLVGVGMGDAS